MSNTDPFAFPVALPRHSFTPREVARASDIWRVCQDVAVEGSSRGGWPPLRYLDVGSAYVMRLMTVVHPKEIPPTAMLWAKTWVSENRRGLVSVRQIRLYDSEDMREPVTRATQEWAHIDRRVGLRRAPTELVEAFPLLDIEPSVTLPAITSELDGPPSEFRFRCWHIWRDALGHLNHPDYVDVCDEGIYEHAFKHGLATEKIEAIGEKVLYRASVEAGVDVSVSTRLAGTIDDRRCVFRHRIMVGDKLCAEATSVRGYPEPFALRDAFLT